MVSMKKWAAGAMVGVGISALASAFGGASAPAELFGVKTAEAQQSTTLDATFKRQFNQLFADKATMNGNNSSGQTVQLGMRTILYALQETGYDHESYGFEMRKAVVAGLTGKLTANGADRMTDKQWTLYAGCVATEYMKLPADTRAHPSVAEVNSFLTRIATLPAVKNNPDICRQMHEEGGTMNIYRAQNPKPPAVVQAQPETEPYGDNIPLTANQSLGNRFYETYITTPRGVDNMLVAVLRDARANYGLGPQDRPSQGMMQESGLGAVEAFAGYMNYLRGVTMRGGQPEVMACALTAFKKMPDNIRKAPEVAGDRAMMVEMERDPGVQRYLSQPCQGVSTFRPGR